jgi:hypothetical protein
MRKRQLNHDRTSKKSAKYRVVRQLFAKIFTDGGVK